MLVDGLVIYGLQVWETRLKKAKAEDEQKMAAEATAANETTKKDKRAQKAATRQQMKQQEKNVLQKSGKANFTAKANIVQPDKNKKQR